MADPRMAPHQRAAVPETVHARQFDDEMILLDLGAGEYFSLDAVGALVWEGLAAGRSAEEVAGAVVQQFDVEFPRALEDVLDLGTELMSAGLLIERR